MDTGCPFTVAGDTWFQSYLNTLSRKDRNSIRTNKSNNKFRFGNGILFPSKYNAVIPIYIDKHKYFLSVDVVDCSIPLLLSRKTLERADAKIHIKDASMNFLGTIVPLTITSSGHMCLRISRSLDTSDTETQNLLTRVLFTTPIDGVGPDLENKARKLHLQFCHPTADRLIDLIKKAGTFDQRVFDAINNVTSRCDICIRSKRAPLRPAVGLPLATQFNETVALDLKHRGSDGYILHIIDHLTRYSAACLIKDKKKETIIRGVMDHWIKIFGPPKYFLMDNGREFVNHEFVDLAEKFNIIIRTTAAESAWSNGLCERHNGILNGNVNKVLSSTSCSLEVAIAWAVAAKNSLANVYGFSPNVLVFGKNPHFPTAFTNKPPANNTTCLNEYVAENLNVMHHARRAFVEQESAERLRRALNRKSRTYSNIVYHQGDHVYYWRNDKADCHGPAVVVGKDGQQFLLKHGGIYIRVHPCRMQLCEERSSDLTNKHSTNHSDNGQPLSSSPNVNSNSSNCPSDDDNSYVTADEASDDESPVSSNNASDEISEPVSDNIRDLQNSQTPETIDWVHVTSTKDLPKVNTHIECQFPNQDFRVKCRILSRAGKASAGNWHLLNIQEGDGEGKSCSFKNASWRLSSSNSSDEHVSSETFYGSCDPAFDLAKQEELNKWKHFDTFIEIPNNGEKTISTRWVCTRKIKGGQVVYKARLVARGFEEDCKTLRTDSPTCSKESLRLCLVIISCHSWKLHTLDVKSAFLQGAPMQREVLIKPPVEACTTHLWKMTRCPYGLADAGRHWYLRLKSVLLNSGLVVSKYDQALFMWYSDDKLEGILACHVDDVIFGGSKSFHECIIDKLKTTFSIGLEENTNLKYLGLLIKQTTNGIHVSTHDYAKSLKPLHLPRSAIENNQEFSSEELTCLKQFCGQINWLSTQARPDIAFETCYMSNGLKSGDRRMFSMANKIIRKIQNQDVGLNYRSDFDISSVYVVSFCDASFTNLPNAGSQGAHVSFLVDKNGLYCPVMWQSRKIRRVVKSTLGAECLAAVEAAENTIYLATLVANILNLSRRIDTFLFCDNRNLVNAVHSSTNLEDKRLVIDISVLRDMIDQQELTAFTWVSTEWQIADALTKQGASTKLLLNVFNGSHLRFDKKSVRFV